MTTDKLIRLTIPQIKEIKDKGFTYVEIGNGIRQCVTMDDILIKKDEVDNYLNKILNNLKNK